MQQGQLRHDAWLAPGDGSRLRGDCVHLHTRVCVHTDIFMCIYKKYGCGFVRVSVCTMYNFNRSGQPSLLGFLMVETMYLCFRDADKKESLMKSIAKFKQ